MWLWSPAAHIRTADQHGDGRPGITRTYDRQGQLAQLAVDANLDGRADVEEYYDRGVLVRRESDRDFNSRVDLVEEFDPATGENARSVVDVDFDGTADLLLLFQGGRAVFSKWVQLAAPAVASTETAAQTSAPPRTADGHLAPLEDPFRGDLSVRAFHGTADPDDSIGLSTSGGLPASSGNVAGPLASSAHVSRARVTHPSSATVLPYSPRGPPPASLPS